MTKIDWRESFIQLGLSALYSEERGFQLPGFILLQNFCRKILQTFFFIGQPDCTHQLHSQKCWSETRCGVSTPLFLCFSLLRVQQKQPVKKELNLDSMPYRIRSSLEKASKVNNSRFGKMLTTQHFVCGVHIKVLSERVLLQECPLWEDIKGCPHHRHRQFQLASNWTCHWPNMSPSGMLVAPLWQCV